MKLPSSLLTASLLVCVASFRTMIFAFGTTAPDESVMVPDKDELSDWPRAELAAVIRHTTTMIAKQRTNLWFFNQALQGEDLYSSFLNCVVVRSPVYLLFGSKSTA